MSIAFIELDKPIPSHISVGKGLALYISGTYYVPIGLGKPDKISFYVADSFWQAETIVAQRIDNPKAGFHSMGFWGLLHLRLPENVSQKNVCFGAVIQFPLSSSINISLGSITLTSTPDKSAISNDTFSFKKADVAICLAAYQPDLQLFRKQISSIKAQSYQDWICIICDDSCNPHISESIQEIIENDERFFIKTNSHRLGVYRNFEKLLNLIPSHIKFVSLADQDDFWYPSKIEELIEKISSVESPLVYGDVRIISESGDLISPSAWINREPNEIDLESQILTTSLYGATCLFKKDVLHYALPFPEPAFGVWTHDRWIGCVAIACGGMKFFPQPLQDYIQHKNNLFGWPNPKPDYHLANKAEKELSLNDWDLLQMNNDFLTSSRQDYFNFVLRSQLTGATLELRSQNCLNKTTRNSLLRINGLTSFHEFLSTINNAKFSIQQKSSSLGMDYHLVRGIRWKNLLEKFSMQIVKKGFSPLKPRMLNSISPLPVTAAFDD